MPYSINGFGTTYYGHREEEPDRSYITTCWITAIFLPLVPIGSYRIWPSNESSRFTIVGVPGEYLVRRTPLNLRQIANVYLVFYGWLILLLCL